MDTLWQDLKYGFRTLTKSPAFLLVTVLSLALGVGANTAVFTVVKAIFLHPVPFRDLHRLVMVSTVDDELPGLLPSSYPNLMDYRDRQQVFSAMAVTIATSAGVSKTSDGFAETWNVEVVSGNFFDTLGVKPQVGRVFSEQNEAPMIVLSHSTWRDGYGSDPGIVGSNLVINRRTVQIAGVMPSGFRGLNVLNEPRAWMPLSMAEAVMTRPEAMRDRKAFYFSAVARLRDGVSRNQAEAALQGISQQLAHDYPEINGGRKVRLTPAVQAAVTPRFRAVMANATLLLMAAVGLVLLNACANVAALLLVKARGRTREFAVRLAVGANAGRIARQMVTESLLLSLLGGAAGLLVARWARDLLWKFRPPWIADGTFDVSLDGSALAFAFSISVVTGVLFGLTPALTAWRRNLATELTQRGSQGVHEHRIFGVRSLLVIGQCSLSLLALVGAGLFIESLRHLQHMSPGFDATHLATMRLDLSGRGYSAPQVNDVYREAVDAASSLPFARSASLSVITPLGGGEGGSVRGTRVEGHEGLGKYPLLLVNAVAPRYFETIGLALFEGRDFTAGDRTGAPHVVVVNQTLARRYWPNQSALGKQIRFLSDGVQRQVVGVVADAKFFSLTEDQLGCIYLPLWQEHVARVSLLVRAQGTPRHLLSDLRTEMERLDPNLPRGGVELMDDIISRSLWGQRLIAGLLSVFGLLALLLAAAGVYGLTAYAVSQRANEIGIRMALGAVPGDVMRQIISGGMTLVILGVGLGAAIAMAAGRVVSNLLFGVTTIHMPTYFYAALILLSVALLACYLPARRATKVDPVLALRHE